MNYNRLTGVIPDMSNITNLQYLLLQDNNLSGNLSAWMSKVPLKALVLSGNMMTGKIPDEWSNLLDLYYLDISNNYITGEVCTHLS